MTTYPKGPWTSDVMVTLTSTHTPSTGKLATVSGSAGQTVIEVSRRSRAEVRKKLLAGVADHRSSRAMATLRCWCSLLHPPGHLLGP